MKTGIAFIDRFGQARRHKGSGSGSPGKTWRSAVLAVQLRPRRRPLGLVLVLMIIVLAFGGCGKKGPPVAPQETQPAAVSDLKGLRQGDRVFLSWSIPEHLDQKAAAPDRFRVCRSKQSLQAAPCSNCPLVFECVADMPVGSTASVDAAAESMQYSEVLERGYRYVYKVIGLRPAGPESYASNLVEVVY